MADVDDTAGSDDDNSSAGQFGGLISEALVQSPTHHSAGTGSLDFDGLLQPPLRLRQDLKEGNGGQAWPAGMVLGKYLLRRRRELLASCTGSIIELGAGGGLVGLAVAMGCQPKGTVHITDQDMMVPLMEQNIALNGLERRVVASEYSWGGAVPAAVTPSESADGHRHPAVVLAADCVYFEPAFPLLLATLTDLLGPQTTCYFCFKRRRRADMHFLKAARKAFVVEEVTDDPEREVYARENIFLLTIRAKRREASVSVAETR